MSINSRVFGLATMIVAAASCFADTVTTHERTVTRLADGIYEIRHPDAPDTFPQGNTTVIIGERGVFVVDSCLLPSSAREDIAQIKKWTDKPVMFLLNTHWHFGPHPRKCDICRSFPRPTDHCALTHTEGDRGIQSRRSRTLPATSRPF
jgi:Metallo-beta-lactamase superfamily